LCNLIKIFIKKSVHSQLLLILLVNKFIGNMSESAAKKLKGIHGKQSLHKQPRHLILLFQKELC